MGRRQAQFRLVPTSLGALLPFRLARRIAWRLGHWRSTEHPNRDHRHGDHHHGSSVGMQGSGARAGAKRSWVGNLPSPGDVQGHHGGSLGRGGLWRGGGLVGENREIMGWGCGRIVDAGARPDHGGRVVLTVWTHPLNSADPSLPFPLPGHPFGHPNSLDRSTARPEHGASQSLF
jgi:hypothetical protein